MTMDRRSLLSSLSALAAAAALPRARTAAAATTAKRPSRYLQLCIAGGMDALYSFDPKEPSQVDRRVVVPYKPDKIVHTKHHKLAPYMSPLAGQAERFALVNGIAGGTVSHEFGLTMNYYYSTDFVTARDVSLAGDIGAAFSPSPDLWEVRVGIPFAVPGRGPRGKTIVLTPDSYLQSFELKRDPARFDRVTDRLRKSLTSTTAPNAKESVRAALTLWDRLMPSVPIAEPTIDFASLHSTAELLEGETKAQAQLVAVIAKYVATALHLLETDVVRSVFVVIPGKWDSHNQHHGTASSNVEIFASVLSWALERMAAHQLPGGTSLLDETLVVASSELGRFPILNVRQGKDHYPEICALFAGGGVRPGQFGVTDGLMAGRPVSLTSGATAPKATRQPVVSDIGATIRSMFGLPLRPSEEGRRFDFLTG